jgi:hypothetical protein
MRKMRKTILLLLACLSIFDCFSQFGSDVFTIGSDNASNYGGSWTNGSNQGTGFGAWDISANANTGVFISNPSNNGMGTTGIGTTAFGIYATGGDYINISRTINNGLRVGDILTFYWAMNFDAGGGSKGFNLKNGATTIFNVNNGNSASITTTNGTANSNYGTSPMLVTVERVSASSYSFSMTARDGGATFTTTISSSSTINEIEIYCGNQNDGAGQKNIYFNNFQLTSKYTIPNGSTSTLSSNLEAPYVEIQSGGTLISQASNSRQLTISTNGAFTNNGTFNANDGKVIFSGSNTVSGSVSFNNTDLNGGVNFGSSSTVNGNISLNSGGFINTNPPAYGGASTLIYNSSGVYGRGLEWSSTAGAGYPHHVQISNNTTLNLGANNGAGIARQCSGNLTVDAGATLSLNQSSEQMTQALTVKGNFTNNGTVTLSGVIGGDLFIGGDLSNSGTLTHNARLIEFNGTGQQTLSSPLNVDYFEVNNAAGIVLNANLTVGATFNLSNGVIDLQGGSVTVTSGGSITGGSSSSYIKTLSTHGLIQEVGGSAVIFPVGNGSYNPVTISNAGTTDNFTVIVENQVLAEGTTGTVQTANAIGRSWNISEDSLGGSDASITVQWNSSDELTGFDPSACFISHFHQATGWSAEGWDPGATEDVSHSDPRTITLSNVSSFSPFGVGSADSPLPVELQSFHVVEQNNRPLLEWVTLSEINSDLFIIETSRDAKEWTPIAKQKAAGTSNTPTNYEYLDKTTEVDEFIYYRLKQLDLDGTYTYSRVVKFEVEVTQLPVNIYPNPTADVLTFQFGNNVERTIKISNLMGEQIMSLPTISNRVFSVNISNLPKGFYFVEIESGGQVEVKKILKQ